MRALIAGIIFLVFFVFIFPASADHALNINTASAEALDSLPGIGPTYAERIIEYREGPNGPFETIEEIGNVQGIGGPGTPSYEDLKGHITVGESAPLQSTAGAGTGGRAQENSQSNVSASRSTGGSVFIPTKSITVDAGADRTAFVGADSVFEARVSGATGEPISNARVVWTFGNGEYKEGQKVLYNFSYP